MKFTLEINMDNASFSLGNSEHEKDGSTLAVMLYSLSTFFEDSRIEVKQKGRVWDTNGNKVGTWEVTE